MYEAILGEPFLPARKLALEKKTTDQHRLMNKGCVIKALLPERELHEETADQAVSD